MIVPPMQKSPSHVKRDNALAKEQSLERKILEWIISGNTGRSSRAMAYCAASLDSTHIDEPKIALGFNRCLNLVNDVPEVREHFPMIAKLSPEWMTIIRNWDRIEKAFLNEAGLNFSKRSSAPITNQLLRDLRAKR